jgi:hypothetical protein
VPGLKFIEEITPRDILEQRFVWPVVYPSRFKRDDTASPALSRVRGKLLQVEVLCSKLQRGFHCKEL